MKVSALMATDYDEVRRDLSRVIILARHLSDAASERLVGEWRLEYASYIFVKICCHAISALRVAPSGLMPARQGETEVWDLGATCAVVRALIDAYFAMYYVSLLQLLQPDPSELRALEAEVERLRGRVLEHPVYGQLASDKKKKIRKGELPLHLPNSNLAMRAGINQNYYRAAFRYLSSYTHTYPFSVSQLIHLRAGDSEALRLFATVLQYCLAFLSVAIRDFRSLFPDLGVSGNPGTEELIDDWIAVVGRWGSDEGMLS